ncbi:Very low-density lipoprotein receptor [Holothuria leucospilota]|uniref:Very low-density lipoprotein receptor n=1 Tax=Holothuria leucospilota TaxID=206669 RepID=A0A9Q0YRF0_HOLLE|nr:Very low-density lipoprotein receptor [Holothuria leucospilota]
MITFWSYRETKNWADIPCDEFLTSQFICQQLNLSTEKCGKDQHRCNSGECILTVYLCDGNRDCSDNSDEFNCSSVQLDQRCPAHHFVCEDGTCIHSTFYCDHVMHCEDNSDENYCDYGDVSFACASGSFIPANRKCDGQLDCPGTKDDEPKECGNEKP